jgi:hypothetical protein
MTRTWTPAHSPNTRLRPGLNHPKLSALLMLVAAALVLGMGARFTTPRAAATTGDPPGDQTFESADFAITLAQDGTVTILDKKTSTALQAAPDPTSEQSTEDEIRAYANNVATQLGANLGWDMAVETDRTRLTNEIQTVRQKLQSIPQATLNLTQNADISTLHDTIEQLYGANECRGRCLAGAARNAFISGGLLVHQIRFYRNLMHRSLALDLKAKALGIVILTAEASIFWHVISRALGDPRMPEGIKRALLLAVGAIFSEVAHAMIDLIQYTAQSRMTMRKELTDTADRIASLAQDTEPTKDDDLVKDEL